MIRFFLLAVVLLCGPSLIAQTFHHGVAPSPKPGTLFIYPERIALQDGGFFTCQRGLLFAPTNRSKSSSDVIAIEFYRFPRIRNTDSSAHENDTEPPPIFILKGGPGFQGLEGELNERGTLEKKYLHFLNVADVIVIGQRGIGSSKPNTIVEERPTSVPADGTHNEEQAIESFQRQLSIERQYWLDQGVDLSGFNVLECAADVHDLSKALGYERITLYGGSFGSHWAIAVMRSHPEIVSRAVLTGLEGPNHTWDHPGWIWNVYKRVAADAEASAGLRHLIPDSGLIATIQSIVERAHQRPFDVTIFRGQPNEATARIDGPAMQYVARGISRRLRDWPAEVIQMSRGNFANAAAVTLRRAKEQRRIYRTASYWMLDSGSGISPKRRAEIESDPAAAIIGNINWLYSAGSPIWKADLGEDFRAEFITEIPTVLVHGTWDTQTPLENAIELEPCFTNHRFVKVHRGSHAALLEAQYFEPKFREALLTFIGTGDSSLLPNEIVLPEPMWTVPK